jgi:hypothetical protein
MALKFKIKSKDEAQEEVRFPARCVSFVVRAAGPETPGSEACQNRVQFFLEESPALSRDEVQRGAHIAPVTPPGLGWAGK